MQLKLICYQTKCRLTHAGTADVCLGRAVDESRTAGLKEGQSEVLRAAKKHDPDPTSSSLIFFLLAPREAVTTS